MQFYTSFKNNSSYSFFIFATRFFNHDIIFTENEIF